MKLTEKMRYSSKLWEIEKTDGTGFLAMAIAYLFDKGISNVKDLTDEEIAEVEMSPREIMTTEYAQHLIAVARTIANYDLYIDVLPYLRFVYDI